MTAPRDYSKAVGGLTFHYVQPEAFARAVRAFRGI